MPTLAGLRRRGYTPEAIRDFCERIGVAKRDSIVDVALLEHAVREDLNRRAPRVMAVLRPLKVVIENYPGGPGRGARRGQQPRGSRRRARARCRSRASSTSSATTSARMPPKKFFRLAPGREVRLRYAYFITLHRRREGRRRARSSSCAAPTIRRRAAATPPDGRKVKATLHWVSAAHAVDGRGAALRSPVRRSRIPSGEGDFARAPEPATRSRSLRDCQARAEPRAAPRRAAACQFERLGYFCVDPRLDARRAGLQPHRHAARHLGEDRAGAARRGRRRRRVALSSMDDYPAPPDRRADPPRRHERPQLLRPLLLQPARLERRAVHGDGARPVPEPRRAGRLRRASRARAATTCVRASRELGDRMDTQRRPVPRRGDRGAEAAALRPRADGARHRLRPRLGGRDPGLPRAAPVHPQARPRPLRHHALRADRLLDGHAHGRRRDASPSRPTAGGARATAPGACARSASRSPRASAAPKGSSTGMWNYSPMQFDDHSILYILNETNDGERVLEEAVRIWTRSRARARVARPPRVRARAHAGHAHDRALDDRASRTRPAARFAVRGDAAPALLHRHRHRLRHGAGLAPRHVPGAARRAGPRAKRIDEIAPLGQYGVVDHVARFETRAGVGYGLHEHGFFGPFGSTA